MIKDVMLVLDGGEGDEIRLEVAAIFPDWFRYRTAARTAAARDALQAWTAAANPDRRQAVDRLKANPNSSAEVINVPAHRGLAKIASDRLTSAAIAMRVDLVRAGSRRKGRSANDLKKY